MEVTDNRVFFSEIKIGEVISLNKKYYEKVTPIISLTEPRFRNCVELSSGKLMLIRDDERVMPVNGKFVIED